MRTRAGRALWTIVAVLAAGGTDQARADVPVTQAWGAPSEVEHTDESVMWRTVGMTATGDVVGAWTTCCSAGSSQVHVAVRTALGVTLPTVSLGHGFNPDVTTDGVDGSLVTWSAGGIEAVRVDATGADPQDIVELPGTTAKGARFPKAAVNVLGQAVVSYDGAWGGLNASLRSADGTWSQPIPLAADYAAQPGHDRASAISSAGRAVVAWSHGFAAGDVRVAVQRTGEAAFAPPVKLNAADTHGGDITMATDALGRTVVGWTETAPWVENPSGTYGVPSEGRVRYAVVEADGTVGPPVDVADEAGMYAGAELGVSAVGEVVIAYVGAKGVETRSGLIGLPLGEPVAVAPGTHANDLNLAVAPTGAAVVSWSRWTVGVDVPESARRLPVGTWERPQDLRVPCVEDDLVFAEDTVVDAVGRAGAILVRWAPVVHEDGSRSYGANTRLELVGDALALSATRTCSGEPDPSEPPPAEPELPSVDVPPVDLPGVDLPGVLSPGIDVPVIAVPPGVSMPAMPHPATRGAGAVSAPRVVGMPSPAPAAPRVVTPAAGKAPVVSLGRVSRSGGRVRVTAMCRPGCVARFATVVDGRATPLHLSRPRLLQSGRRVRISLPAPRRRASGIVMSAVRDGGASAIGTATRSVPRARG